jgi:hypothetical protein
MAKSKVSSKDTPRQETIHPYFPNDCKIIKKVNGSGKATYHHPAHKKEGDGIYTWESDLYSQIAVSLERFEMLVGMACEKDFDKFSFLFDALMRDTKNQLDEVFEHIRNTIGIINLEMVGGVDNSIYRCGMVLGVSTRPGRKTKGSPETAT